MSGAPNAKNGHHGDASAGIIAELRHAGRFTEAEAACRLWIDRDPDHWAAHFELGHVLRQIGRLAEAGEAYAAAVCFRPDYPPALLCLGAARRLCGDPEGALTHYQRAVAIRPEYPEALNNMSVVLTDMGRIGEAQDCCRRALAIRPNMGPAMNNLARTYKYSGRIQDAVGWYNRALGAMPEDPAVISNYLYSLCYADHIPVGMAADAHRRWGQTMPTAASPPVPLLDGPFRIGYLSADFFQHPVARFLEPILEGHNRQAVSPICISTGSRSDGMTERLKRQSDGWLDIRSMSDTRAAEVIRATGIHIMVDLGGHTAGNRLGLMAQRPAPVQFAYLGYPATTGLPTIDFRITDPWADPPGAQRYHSEQLVRLDDGFLCYRAPSESPTVTPRAQQSPPTIGSFNNLAKVTPAVLDCWAAILRAMPEARLLLKFRSLADASVRSDMTARMVRRGVAGDRLILLGHLPTRAAHLETYGHLDLALDTFPYNGTTTTCEALWMGVPVVTLAGDAHAGRVGVSILTMINRRQWIADSTGAYVDIVCGLLADRDRLARERAEQRTAMARSPLMDQSRIVTALEHAYAESWHTKLNTPPGSGQKRVAN